MPLPFVACLRYRIFKKRYKNDLHSPKKRYKIREKKLKNDTQNPRRGLCSHAVFTITY